jgi:hypothetical protein
MAKYVPPEPGDDAGWIVQVEDHQRGTVATMRLAQWFAAHLPNGYANDQDDQRQEDERFAIRLALAGEYVTSAGILLKRVRAEGEMTEDQVWDLLEPAMKVAQQHGFFVRAFAPSQLARPVEDLEDEFGDMAANGGWLA